MTHCCSLTSYEQIKLAALNSNIPPLELERIKLSWKSKIASKRRFDFIRSIGDLIDLLEKRDELSEDNIEFFYRLDNLCRLPALREALSHNGVLIYKKCLEHPPLLINKYRESRFLDLHIQRNTADVSLSQGYPSRELSRPSAVLYPFEIPDDKKKAIYKKLCKELGKDWRNFGRELNIREGEMDNIESQSQDLFTRITKLLIVFEEDESNEPKEYFLLLCRALDNCKRKDLRRYIEKIMSC